MEIDPQEGPLALQGIRDTLNRVDVNRNPSCLRVRDQDSVALCVNIDLSWLEILWVIFNRAISKNSVHFLDFLLCFGALDLTSVKSELQISLLELV